MTANSGITGKTVDQAARTLAAMARQEIRDQRSPAEQLAELDSRPGESRRERKRLEKVIERTS